MTKKEQQQRLVANATERLKWLGAEDKPGGLYELSLPTRCGPLNISFHPETLRTGKPATITIFTRFYDPAAIAAFGLNSGNRHTGKWNWHCLDRDGVDAFIKKVEGFQP